MKTLGEMTERNARYFPAGNAFTSVSRRVSNYELAARARRLSSFIYRAGLRRQDRVAILSTNCVEYFETYRACEWAGFIAATVNFRLAPREILYILQDASPRTLVFEAQYTALVDQLRAELPTIEQFICIGVTPQWAVPFEQAIADGDEAGPPIRAQSQDYAYLMYTSGTTGTPKGVVRTHHAMCRTAESCALITEFSGATRVLQTTPAFHIGGIGFVNSAAWMGGSTVVHQGFDPLAALRAIEEERVTFTFMVAAMLQTVLDLPQIDDFNLKSLEHVVTAAAPIPVPLLKRAIERLGPIFSVQYGMTESNACALPRHEVNPNGSPDQIRRLESVGLPAPGFDLRIVNDEGHDCLQGETGEVLLRSDTQLSCYWNNSVATMEALRDGWYHTGDMGYQDHEGYLFLVDRKKDMIISGGENIYSREVEVAIELHPQVLESAVIGIPDPRWGEAVKAFIVPAPGARLTETELIGHCKSVLASYKCPKAIEFISELPRIATGKINKVALRERALASNG
ncbi:acyl-CoA synthetase (AMP-forming)/AMP-acid ligase II [Pseudomonas lini]|jgi:acyl-CoA synthetase (AMP-forming)/AMP-acid ligase II|uniref:class I adenylate-forming enzyme family protein n=1 Tax=Pseudomonas lini TaxID=163011 RepID=UPI0027851226|nr:long-chain-fatty-acid--CoA ligase [Pseudomonas lini]MDQ0124886.1 acyl-CoA synthetase (AMP-forming)/AMP-acid ligase II [Pseudomonas lini]